MNACSISGGGLNIFGLGAALVELYKQGKTFDVYAGTSAGAYLAAVASIASPFRIEQAYKNEVVNIKDAFKIKPLRNGGGISLLGVLRLLTFRESVGLQDARPLLKKVISELDFWEYQHKASSPDCFVCTVSLSNNRSHMFNLKDDARDYQEAIDMIECSSRIVPMVQPMQFRGDFWADGGHRDHNPSAKLLQVFGGIEHLTTIWAGRNNTTEQPQRKTWLGNWMKITDIAHNEASLSDEQETDLQCEKLKIKHTKIKLPKVLNHYYDTDPLRILTLMQRSIKTVQDAK